MTDEGRAPQPVPGRIAVVGVCAAGKSALVSQLCSLGYDARSCAQEHSYVPDMWRRLSRPQVLIYLDASLEVARQRRHVAYEERYLHGQRTRLAHARAHCHIYVNSDALDEPEVLRQVLEALRALGHGPSRSDLAA
ncbi:MAG: hypothetical protein V1772_14330 [Chloroflexota bacterium]